MVGVGVGVGVHCKYCLRLRVEVVEKRGMSCDVFERVLFLLSMRIKPRNTGAWACI